MNRLVRRQRAALALFIALTVSGVGVALADPQGEQPNTKIDVSPDNGQNLPDAASVQVTGTGFGVNQSGLIVQAAELPNGTTALSNTLGTFTSNSSGTFSTTANVTRTFVAAGTGETIDCNAPGVQCYVQATSTSGQFQALHTISFAGGATTSSTSTSTTLAPTTTSTTLAPTTTSTTLAPTTTSTTLLPTTTSTTLLPTTTSTTVAPTTTTTLVPTTTTTIGGGPVTTLGPTQCAQIRAARAQLNAQIDAARAAIIQSGLSPQQQAASLAQLEAIRAQGNAQLDALLAGCPAP